MAEIPEGLFKINQVGPGGDLGHFLVLFVSPPMAMRSFGRQVKGIYEISLRTNVAPPAELFSALKKPEKSLSEMPCVQQNSSGARGGISDLTPYVINFFLFPSLLLFHVFN